MLVYDITKRDSFEDIKGFFFVLIKENCKKDTKIVVLGNKTDLEEEREVNPEEGSNFAAENGYMFLETSCLKNQNVSDGFETLIELICKDKGEKKNENNIKISKNPKLGRFRRHCC